MRPNSPAFPMTPTPQTLRQTRPGVCAWLPVVLAAMFTAITLTAAQASADDTPLEADARAFAETLVRDLSTIAGDDALDDDARAGAFRETLSAALAAGPMGRFVLGARARESATPDQLARYEAAFPLYIAEEFSAQIDLLADQRIEVEGVLTRPQRTDEVIVQSQMYGASGRRAARVDWRVRAIDGAPLLIVVLVDRVSPLVTKREEVSSLVAREGMEALLAEMETLTPS